MKKSLTLPQSIPARELCKREVVLDFVLPGLLLGTVGGVISPGGVGKSFWALQLGLQVAGAFKGDMIGGAVAAGRVVIFSAEDSILVTTKRLQDMVAQDLACAQDMSALHIHPLAGVALDLMDEDCFAELVSAAKGARLVILDTLKRFHQLDENSTQDMSRVLAQMERLAIEANTAVVFLHHTTKSAVLNGQQTLAQAARGASVIVDNCRWLSFLAPMSETEARSLDLMHLPREAFVRWNISKQNYGAPVPDKWFLRKEGGVLHPVALKPAHPRYEAAPRKLPVDGPMCDASLELGTSSNKSGLIVSPAPVVPNGDGFVAYPSQVTFGSEITPHGEASAPKQAVPARQVFPSAKNVNGGDW